MTLRLKGSTSGHTEIKAPAAAGDNTITLPTSNGSAEQFLKNSGTAGELEYSSMVETSTGVGIGTSTPKRLLHLNGGNETVKLQITNTTTGSADDGQGYQLGIATDGTAFVEQRENLDLFFSTNNTERARIDSSGRLLVGTTSNFVRGNIQAVDSGGGEITIARNDTSVSSGNDIGHLFYCANDSDTGELVVADISCHADADHSSGSAAASLRFNVVEGGSTSTTERMRLDNGGQLLIFTAGNPITAGTSQGSGTSFDILTGLHSRSSVSSGGTVSVRIYSNGNIQNTNNSYGQLSDIKLKENIVNADSQWDDIKGVQVRNFNFKEETGNPTHTQIGVVAQELETVSPGLVYETPDHDEEGNDLGTVTKSVSYSVLYMKAVKALQEAQTRIETLETQNTAQQTQIDDLLARVTALEAA